MHSEGTKVSRSTFTIKVSNPERNNGRHAAAVASLVATRDAAFKTVLMIDAQKNCRHSPAHNRAVATYNKAETELSKLELRRPELIVPADWYKRIAEFPIDRSRR